MEKQEEIGQSCGFHFELDDNFQVANFILDRVPILVIVVLLVAWAMDLTFQYPQIAVIIIIISVLLCLDILKKNGNSRNVRGKSSSPYIFSSTYDWSLWQVNKVSKLILLYKGIAAVFPKVATKKYHMPPNRMIFSSTGCDYSNFWTNEKSQTVQAIELWQNNQVDTFNWIQSTKLEQWWSVPKKSGTWKQLMVCSI